MSRRLMTECWRDFVRDLDQMDAAHLFLSPEVENCSAVYFLWREGGLLYVGKSTELASRMWAHHRARRIPAGVVSYLHVDAPLLEFVEAAYIHALKPAYNRKYDYSRWEHHDRMVRLIARIWRKHETPARRAGVLEMAP